MDMIGSTPVHANSGFTAPQGRSTMGMTAGLSGHRPQLSLSSTPQYTPISSQPQPPMYLFGNTATPLRPTPMAMGSVMSAPSASVKPNTNNLPTAPPVKNSSNFDDLWSLSLGSSSAATPAAGAGKSIKDLEKEKATNGLWGAGPKKASNTSTPAAFGTFNAAPPGGVDDLLL